MRTLIVLLAHNEGACIQKTVRELAAATGGLPIAVVDDGSSDDTAAQAVAGGAVVLRHPFNLGVAAGEATGLRYALRRGFDCAIRMDGDGQHDPVYVSEMVKALEGGADLAIGSRFLGVESFRSTGMRRLGNQLIARILGVLCHQTFTDATSGFRAFGARALKLLSVTHPHDFPEPESVFLAHRRGLKIVEVPVKMRPRLTGASSLTPLRSAFYMFKVSFALLLELARRPQLKEPL